MAAIVSIIAELLALVNAVSDCWAVVNAHAGCADCFSSPVSITVTECGRQLGSMVIWVVLALVSYGAPISTEIIEGVVDAHLSP